MKGIINQRQNVKGKVVNTTLYIDPITQEKEAIPTEEIQILTPDEGFTGLSKVTVKAIPEEYKKYKIGNKTITQNGEYNAKNDNLDAYDLVIVKTNGVEITTEYNMREYDSIFQFVIGNRNYTERDYSEKEVKETEILLNKILGGEA